MVNEVLKEGIPLPVHPLFKLNKPKVVHWRLVCALGQSHAPQRFKVKIQERSILLQSNLELNEPLMSKLLSQELRRR